MHQHPVAVITVRVFFFSILYFFLKTYRTDYQISIEFNLVIHSLWAKGLINVLPSTPHTSPDKFILSYLCRMNKIVPDPNGFLCLQIQFKKLWTINWQLVCKASNTLQRLQSYGEQLYFFNLMRLMKTVINTVFFFSFSIMELSLQHSRILISSRLIFNMYIYISIR